MQSDIGQRLSYGVKTLAIVYPGGGGGGGGGGVGRVFDVFTLCLLFLTFYRSIVS